MFRLIYNNNSYFFMCGGGRGSGDDEWERGNLVSDLSE